MMYMAENIYRREKMFSNDFVVCILRDGKVVDEDRGGVARLPFGQEYTIYLKNKHSRRAVAEISIDDVHIGDFVVNAHSSVEIKRPADRDVGFKFVSVNSDEAKMEGKSEDDASGVVTVKWSLEKICYRPPYRTPDVYKPWGNPWVYPTSPQWVPPVGPTITYMSCTRSMMSNSHSQCYNMSTNNPQYTTINDFDENPPSLAGVTVDGGVTNQTFRSISMDLESTTTTMIIVLRGLDIKAEKKAKQNKTLAEIKKIKEQLNKLEQQYASEIS